MRSLRLALCGVALASVVGLAACGSDDDGIGATTTPPTTAAASTPESSQVPSTAVVASTPMAGSTPSDGQLTLEGVTWTLSDDTDLGVDLAGVDVTARFEAGTVSGLSGCNRYTGSYSVSGDALTIDPSIAGTRMACPAAQSAVEAAYLAVLPTVASSTIDGDTLRLQDASGTTILVFTHIAGDELLAGEWTVTAVRNGDAVSSPVAGSALTITFADGRVSGDAGCNTFNGPATIAGDELSIGPLVATRRACIDEAVTKQETEFLAALEDTATFSATGSMVTLLAADGTITAVLAAA